MLYCTIHDTELCCPSAIQVLLLQPPNICLLLCVLISASVADTFLGCSLLLHHHIYRLTSEFFSHRKYSDVVHCQPCGWQGWGLCRALPLDDCQCLAHLKVFLIQPAAVSSIWKHSSVVHYKHWDDRAVAFVGHCGIAPWRLPMRCVWVGSLVASSKTAWWTSPSPTSWYCWLSWADVKAGLVAAKCMVITQNWDMFCCISV